MNKVSMLVSLTAVGLSLSAEAGSLYHRLIWDGNAQTQATIGFTPNGGNDHHVMWGSSNNEATWQRANVTASRSFSSLSSQFVKLTGLSANSKVYYRVCDSTGCGERLWFQTAPSNSSGFTVVAGGDTRTGWTTRRQGNQLIAKLRPLFIMHGGDYTNANNSSEMTEYLKDWQLTFSDDVIDGQSYKRIYPFIATHGNHEDGNFNTLCEVFGVDYNQDGQCNANDTYGAVNISPLLRVYTLNSQFQNSGWSSYATAMNNWLSNDLSSSQSAWKFGQYHKPMFPHYSGKSDNTTLYNWWASLFYSKGMHLIVESDTHINKLTYPVQPSGSNFSSTTSGGTVYVGEGSWGAPARSANDPKNWTIDLASIQQFKVISVTPDELVVRTAQFDANADALSQPARDADPLALPANVNWWSAATVGDAMTLVKTSNGLVKIKDEGPVDPELTELQNGEVRSSLSAAKSQKLNFTLQVPNNASNLVVSSSGGTGDADLYVKFGSEPTDNSFDCRPYETGNNETCTIATPQQGTYYIQLNAYKDFVGLSLKAQYQSGTTTEPHGGDTKTNLSAAKDEWYRLSFELPANVKSLTVQTSGGTGDADLYVRQGNEPSTGSFDCRPYKDGNTETCTLNTPKAGTWYIGVRAYAAYSGLTLNYAY
ncbi:pre-peptidase C-terminal domain-containing protein [Pseudoalteromonas xiamenensis]|uniref:pre-peptidase C-terminal domain-containing protein n=1 Tax=Pseudoalteromonas xiamenensis TaxID=882626 RepID=UPI0027E49BF0|nr:pre-peptidase C-terminal domain-containing protein [Pseudoalteromonas xiamenensis]WMN60584.1 pre-peptidase C-terminal domain-containing protein [Pseudoalteromonas xiamenensis]